MLLESFQGYRILTKKKNELNKRYVSRCIQASLLRLLEKGKVRHDKYSLEISIMRQNMMVIAGGISFDFVHYQILFPNV